MSKKLIVCGFMGLIYLCLKHRVKQANKPNCISEDYLQWRKAYYGA